MTLRFALCSVLPLIVYPCFVLFFLLSCSVVAASSENRRTFRTKRFRDVRRTKSGAGQPGDPHPRRIRARSTPPPSPLSSVFGRRCRAADRRTKGSLRSVLFKNSTVQHFFLIWLRTIKIVRVVPSCRKSGTVRRRSVSFPCINQSSDLIKLILFFTYLVPFVSFSF